MILWHHLKNIPAVQYVIDKYISFLFFYWFKAKVGNLFDIKGQKK